MSDILCEVDDGLAAVTLNRPSFRNSATLAMWGGIGDVLQELDGSRGVLHRGVRR